MRRLWLNRYIEKQSASEGHRQREFQLAGRNDGLRCALFYCGVSCCGRCGNHMRIALFVAELGSEERGPLNYSFNPLSERLTDWAVTFVTLRTVESWY